MNKKAQNLSDTAIYKQVSGSLYRNASKGRAGWMVEMIQGVFLFFVNMGAFTVRVFLRRKMGNRSFGFLSIILSYIWLRIALIVFYGMGIGCSEYYQVIGECSNWQRFKYFILQLLEWIFSNPASSNSGGSILYYFSPFNYPSGAGYSLHIFSIIVIAIGSLHYLYGVYIDIAKIKWYSLHRGKSLFFNWLNGKKIGQLEVTEHLIWSILDSLLIFLIAEIINLTLDASILTRAIELSALCLFIQEFQVWAGDKNMIKNVIDQEIEAEYLVKEREKYKTEGQESQKEILEQHSKAYIS